MDVYRIGVSIALANGVSPVLAIIGKDLLGLNTSIKGIEQNFGGWAKALVGVGAILTGTTILGAMTKLVEKTKDFQDELIKLQRLGGDIGQAAASGALTSRAFDMANRVPMKVEDLLKVKGSTYSIIGEEESMKIWEPLARYAWVAGREKNGAHGGGGKDDLQALIRAGEMSGRIYGADSQISSEKLTKFIDEVTKVTAATHGMVNPQSILALAQQGGPALRGLTDEGFLTLLVQSQAMGGHRAGTAYLSLWQQLAGGTMMKRTAEGMQEMGFLKPNEWSSEGGHVSISPEASKRLMTMIGKDPLSFAGQINAELAKRGITDPAEQFQAVMRMTGRQTTQRFTAEEVIAFNQMKAEIERLKQGVGVSGSMDLMHDKSISANMQAVSNAWNNLIIAVGGPQGENFVKILQGITSAIQSATSFANAHPDAIKTMLAAVGAIAAALVAIGGISLVALAGLPGLITAGVAAITAIIAINWQKIVEDFTHFKDAVTGLGSIAWQKITSMFDGIKNAISSFIDAVANILGKVGWMFGFGSNKMPGIEEHPLKHKSMFNPSVAPTKASPIALSLDIDGRTLAQAMSDQFESLYGYPTGAPSPDGSGRFYGGDHNFTST